jgi:GTP-binding protein
VALDREVVSRLRSSQKPILVAVNKVDHEGRQSGLADFTQLGLERLFPVSAIHGLGISELMTSALSFLPADPEHTGEAPEPGSVAEVLKLAIVGRPNVGKSSIINALTRSNRVIVTPIAGTTRDAVDVPFEVETDGVRQKYILIDTAGVRQQRRVDNSIEFFSVKRTEDSIGRADIVVFVIDAESGITVQDKKIAGKIVEEKRACIVVINKWDLVEESVLTARKKEIVRRNDKEGRVRGAAEPMTTLSEFAEWVQEQMFFLDYAPVIFTSAKSGFHLDRLLEAVRYVAAQLKQKVPTSLLNRALNDAIERRQPVSSMGHRLKFFYAAQVRQAPPTFLLFVNRDELFSDQYAKYLGGELRKSFGFEGCPLILVPKPRPKTVAPIRKYKVAAERQASGRGVRKGTASHKTVSHYKQKEKSRGLRKAK